MLNREPGTRYDPSAHVHPLAPLPKVAILTLEAQLLVLKIRVDYLNHIYSSAFPFVTTSCLDASTATICHREIGWRPLRHRPRENMAAHPRRLRPPWHIAVLLYSNTPE